MREYNPPTGYQPIHKLDTSHPPGWKGCGVTDPDVLCQSPDCDYCDVKRRKREMVEQASGYLLHFKVHFDAICLVLPDTEGLTPYQWKHLKSAIIKLLEKL